MREDKVTSGVTTIKNDYKYLHSRLITKWEHTGSNRGPSACKADALNQLSYAPFFIGECKDKF